jgi:hypothetical protein
MRQRNHYYFSICVTFLIKELLGKHLSFVKNKFALQIWYTSTVSLSDGQDGVTQPHKRLDAGWNTDSIPGNHVLQTVLGSTRLLYNGHLGLSGAVTKLPEHEADTVYFTPKSRKQRIFSSAHGRLHGAELSHRGKVILVADNLRI